MHEKIGLISRVLCQFRKANSSQIHTITYHWLNISSYHSRTFQCHQWWRESWHNDKMDTWWLSENKEFPFQWKCSDHDGLVLFTWLWYWTAVSHNVATKMNYLCHWFSVTCPTVSCESYGYLKSNKNYSKGKWHIYNIELFQTKFEYINKRKLILGKRNNFYFM